MIAKTNRPVKWHSPMGLPIVQPYLDEKKFVISTQLQTFTVMLPDRNSPATVLKTRQRSAFPPNYVHSLDSTHMMMTALACRDEGLTFAGAAHTSSTDVHYGENLMQRH